MLSDLAQYFTKKNEQYCETKITEFFRFIYKYTLSDEIRATIESAFSSANIFMWDDLLSVGINEDIYLNDVHFCDVLDMQCDNVFVTLAMSVLMSTMEFSIYFDDFDLIFMFDSEDNIERLSKFRTDSYTPYKLNRKLDRKIDDFIKEVLDMLQYYSDPGYIDAYEAETHRIMISVIQIKNKSMARKLRKAYANNEKVRDMFNELNYYMINGELVFLLDYDIEAAYFSNEFNMKMIYEGLSILRNDYFKVEADPDENITFERHVKRVEQYYSESINENYYMAFLRSIIEQRDAPEKEVIL